MFPLSRIESMPESFAPLPPVPDHPALERTILALWEDEGPSTELRDRNRGGPTFSFMDGPITANNPAGVHHAWGRTLKDVFQRYKALRGYDQRYQNGFDCQGLWVEVEVEKSLGPQLEARHRGVRARRVRRALQGARRAVLGRDRPSSRSGSACGWTGSNDYYTFSDTNIEYIWRFLKEVHSRGWLYKGHRSTQWCPRCGTSLSQHEQAGEENYVELEHPSLFVRFPLLDREGESLVVWTTTPWTLPANVAAAVKPDAEYGRRENGDWVAVERFPDDDVRRASARRRARRAGVPRPVRRPAGAGGRRPPRDPVGRGRRSTRAPASSTSRRAAAPRTSSSRAIHGLPVLDADRRVGPDAARLRRARRAVDDRGRRAGGRAAARARAARRGGHDRPPLPDLLALQDAARLPRRRRLVHLRATRSASRCSTRTRPSSGRRRSTSKRMDDWLRNMGDWNISRKRYFGLPLPFYPCDVRRPERDRLARGARGARDRPGSTQLQELHRPWIDDVTIRCEHVRPGGRARIVEVGDAWLDAGIVHFSTLGWQNPDVGRAGQRDRRGGGADQAPTARSRVLGEVVPGGLGLGDARADPAVVLLAVLHGGDARRPLAVSQRAHVREGATTRHGRPMHKSSGNAIELNEALERMGADVARWLFCEQQPSQPLRFGYGMADDVKRRLLTFWNSVSFFVTYANIESFDPDAPRRRRCGRSTAGSSSRTRAARARRDRRVRALLDARRRAGVRGVRRRPVELVHPPLATAVLGRATATALRVLWDALDGGDAGRSRP